MVLQAELQQSEQALSQPLTCGLFPSIMPVAQVCLLWSVTYEVGDFPWLLVESITVNPESDLFCCFFFKIMEHFNHEALMQNTITLINR